EYDDNTVSTIEGAFYAASSYHKPVFNYFREEIEPDFNKILKSSNNDVEDFILKDNNLQAIKYTPEFSTNKNPTSPTNRLSNSMLRKERLDFILRYAIAFV